jgi:hypothetical protein
MVYAKGKSVFELIDPDGHIYVLHAHDAQFPIESLAKLGEQMSIGSVLRATVDDGGRSPHNWRTAQEPISK